jgi:hypothetical protein
MWHVLVRTPSAIQRKQKKSNCHNVFRRNNKLTAPRNFAGTEQGNELASIRIRSADNSVIATS